MTDQPTNMTIFFQRRRAGGFRRGGALISGAVVTGSRAAKRRRQVQRTSPQFPEWIKIPGEPTGSSPIYGTPSPFERASSKTLQEPASISIRVWTDTAAGSRRHHHAKRAVLRAPPRRRARHRSRPAPPDDPRARRDAPDPDDGRHPPLPVGIAHPLPRMLRQSRLRSHGKTASDLVGLVSCAEWTGVQPETVLQRGGPQAGAQWVVAEGADAAALTRSIPIEKCLDDAILVYSQNGERLRPQQGYPLRLFLPGFEGNMNVKWLRRLNVTAEPAYSREETSKYTDLMPDGTAREFTFVHGGEVDHHAPLGHAADRSRVPRDLRDRLERARQDQGGRGLGRRWPDLAGAAAAGAGADAGADPVPPALELGRAARPSS